MFIAIYKFTIKPEKKDQFVESWYELTELIYKYEGSLGSRLHQENDITFIAYAQWPNKETWQNAGDKIPESATRVKSRMKDACDAIQTIHELECVKDYLQTTLFKDSK